MDRAAEAKPRKEGVLMDNSLSPVPEVVGSVCSVSKAMQTEAPPTSPPPSTREKVRCSTKTILWEDVEKGEYDHTLLKRLKFNAQTSGPASLFFSFYEEKLLNKKGFYDWLYRRLIWKGVVPNFVLPSYFSFLFGFRSFTVGVIFMQKYYISAETLNS